MSFSHCSWTLRSDETYKQNITPEISVNAEKFTNASEQPNAEENNANYNRISAELIEERTWANFGDLNEQILNPAQLINVLVHTNSVKTTPTVI